MNRGFWAAVGAFLIWGLLPLYLRQLHGVPALQIMAHRLLCCCLFVNLWLLLRGEFGKLRFALAVPATRWRLLATALLVSVNWLVYVWSVNAGHVLEASLGYFINPLVNVLLGVLVLRERLNRIQWGAVALAGSAVLYLSWQSGAPPWIALTLAITFGSYGLIRKTVAVDAITGLGAETLLIAPFGLVYLLWLQAHSTGVFGPGNLYIDVLLCLGGLITAIPLALFAYGARRIPYSTVGLIQYIGPTLQLLFGIFLFREPFTAVRALGFAMIWAALLIYAADGLIRAQRARRTALAATASTGAPAATTN